MRTATRQFRSQSRAILRYHPRSSLQATHTAAVWVRKGTLADQD